MKDGRAAGDRGIRIGYVPENADEMYGGADASSSTAVSSSSDSVECRVRCLRRCLVELLPAALPRADACES